VGVSLLRKRSASSNNTNNQIQAKEIYNVVEKVPERNFSVNASKTKNNFPSEPLTEMPKGTAN